MKVWIVKLGRVWPDAGCVFAPSEVVGICATEKEAKDLAAAIPHLSAPLSTWEFRELSGPYRALSWRLDDQFVTAKEQDVIGEAAPTTGPRS